MARGLSELQRWILQRARSKGPGGRLYYDEIFGGYFGWKPAMERYRGGGPGGKRFDPSAIGRRQYNNTMSAVSRACARLRDRGLVECLRGRSTKWAAVVAIGQDEGKGTHNLTDTAEASAS